MNASFKKKRKKCHKKNLCDVYFFLPTAHDIIYLIKRGVRNCYSKVRQVIYVY